MPCDLPIASMRPLGICNSFITAEALVFGRAGMPWVVLAPQENSTASAD